MPNIREKIVGLADDGNRRIVVDMERVTAVGDAVPPMFIGLLNLLRGKGGRLVLIFRNTTVSTALGAFRNIFEIYPDTASYLRGGLFGLLRQRRTLLSRKTGVRLSRSVAVFVLVVLFGWFMTLAFVIVYQNDRIHSQERELQELTRWKQQSTLELNALRDRLRPLEQLGIVRDTVIRRP